MTHDTTLRPTGGTAPGPRGHPLLGIIPEMRRDPLGFLRDVAQQYGDVVRYRIGYMPSYLVLQPDAVRQVLQENVKNYSKDHFSYGIVRWIAGNGLLTSQGSFWLRQRRLAQPAFHRQRITGLGDLMVAATSDMLAEWQVAANNGQQIDAAEHMMRLTLRIVGEALFGTNVSQQAQVVSSAFGLLSNQVVGRFRSFNLLPPVLPTRNDRSFRAAVRQLDTVIYQIIGERRQNVRDQGDLLSMLLLARDEETGEQMDDRQLRDEVLTMLVAGHETTATALAWLWALLAQHPAVEAQLHHELDTVLGQRAPTMADLPNLPYTRMVLEETLRLYPPVYIFSRKALATDTLGGYRIPAGAWIDISPYLTHRHPALWERPAAFEPGRFAPELVAQRPRYAYFPFSGGPRQCIGNSFALTEAQLVVATIAQRYRLRLASTHMPEPEPLITLRPRGGLPVYVEARRMND